MCNYFLQVFIECLLCVRCCIKCTGGDPAALWSEFGVLKECQETHRLTCVKVYVITIIAVQLASDPTNPWKKPSYPFTISLCLNPKDNCLPLIYLSTVSPWNSLCLHGITLSGCSFYISGFLSPVVFLKLSFVLFIGIHRDPHLSSCCTLYLGWFNLFTVTWLLFTYRWWYPNWKLKPTSFSSTLELFV